MPTLSFSILVLIAALFVLGPCRAQRVSLATAHADSGVSTDTREGRLAVFDDAWQTVHDRYYSSNFNGVDWMAQRSIFRPLAADSRDSRELYASLRRMLGVLKDAHTRVYAPEEKFDWQHPRFVGIGISLREVDGHPTIFAVDRGSAAERAGLHPGDVLQKIGGESAAALLEIREREQFSSTPRAARLLALASLTDGQPGTNLQVEWKAANEQEVNASLKREWHERNFSVKAKRLQSGFVIVELDAFTQNLALEFAHTVRDKLTHARGIILDLRGNGGGDASAMAQIASAFLPPATKLGQFIDRHGNVALTLETETTRTADTTRVPRVRAPLVILTSERTSSAAEILAEAFKQTSRATIIGGQTCGCVLAVRTHHALPDGGELDVSELDYHTASGDRLEGEGVKPDETVGLTRLDLYKHRDRLREAGLAKLRASRR